jgi:hypothetical protein
VLALAAVEEVVVVAVELLLLLARRRLPLPLRLLSTVASRNVMLGSLQGDAKSSLGGT